METLRFSLNCFQMFGGVAGAVAAIKNSADTLKSLTIFMTVLENADFESIQPELKKCMKLTALNIDCNFGLGSRGAELVADLIISTDTLEQVCVSGCPIGYDGINFLAEAVRKTKKLRRLEISYTAANEASLLNLADAVMHNTTLEILDLSRTMQSREFAWKFGRVVLMRPKPLHLETHHYKAIVQFYEEKRPPATRIFALMAGAASQSRNQSVKRFLRSDGDTRILRRVAIFGNHT